MALSDLEQIQQDIVDVRSRELIAEVVRCYECGAYRGALVSLWVAVVADITGKIRYLAESGDGTAGNVINDLDSALSSQSVVKVQKYEREILETAGGQLGILLPREKVELERLNQDRNLCAHPGYLNDGELFMPDAELVRAHLVAASRSVFSQRPLAGKRLLISLDSEIKGAAWPSRNDYFLDRFFRVARKSVQSNMAKVLIKHSMRPPDGDNLVAQRALCAALSIADESPLLFEDALHSVLCTWEDGGKLGDSELIRASGAYGGKSLLWGAIPNTGKARLEKLLDTFDIDFLLKERFFISGTPGDACIADKFKEIVSLLDVGQLFEAVKQSMNRSSYVQAAIDRVRNSKTFRDAETSLRVVELCSEQMSDEDVVLLCGAIQQNRNDQVRLAGETESILMNIFSASSKTEGAVSKWRELAEWLHAGGDRRDGEDYRYEDFFRLVYGLD